MKDDEEICLVSLPVSESGIVPLSDMVEIICDLKGKVHLVSGNVAIDKFGDDRRVALYGIEHTPKENLPSRILAYILLQLKIAIGVAKAPSKISNFLFFVGGPVLLPAILVAKLRKNNVNILLSGSDIKSIRAESKLLALPIRLLVSSSLYLADHIVVYSENIIKDMCLEKYTHKTYIAHRHFLDFEIFEKRRDLDERPNVIGFIGRLSEEKGFKEFMKAIPQILSFKKDFKIVIIGEGKLKDEAVKFVKERDLEGKIEFISWVQHEKIPKHLNEMKLLIMPSLTEGLPNVMLEAMACGTPVLASPVGAIPDIIEDEMNGFLIEDRSPESLAKDAKRCLERDDLEEVSECALMKIKNDFSFENVVELWDEMLEKLNT